MIEAVQDHDEDSLDRRRALLDGWVTGEREIARVHARQASLLAERLEISAIDSGSASDSRPDAREVSLRSLAAEYAAAAHIPPSTASIRLTEAWMLVRCFPATHAALAAGLITRQHADVILAEAPVVTGHEDAAELRGAYEQAVLPVAQSDTAARTRAHARATTAVLCSETVEDAHKRAREERCVTVRSDGDGMAVLTAILPEILAYAIHDRLTAQARDLRKARAAAKACAEPRAEGAPMREEEPDGPEDTISLEEQLDRIFADDVPDWERAAKGSDSSVDDPAMSDDATDSDGATAPADATAAESATAADDATASDDASAAESTTAADSAPASDDATAAETATAVSGVFGGEQEPIDELVDEGEFIDMSDFDPWNDDLDTACADGLWAATDSVATECEGFAYDLSDGDWFDEQLAALEAAFYADPPHPPPLPEPHDGNPARDARSSTEILVDDSRTMDQVRADLLADLLLTADASVVMQTGLESVHATVQVTLAATTVAGCDHRLAEFDGHGPALTDDPLLLAGQSTVWTRLFLDTTGVVTSVDSYVPTAAMKRFLRARDQHCRFPGCRAPVHRCQNDHNLDFAQGGRTSLDNLALFCTSHHPIKHPDLADEDRWTARQLDGGTIEWRSPLGRSYTDSPSRRVMFV